MRNKDRKRELKAAFKAGERDALENSLPLSKDYLQALFKFLGNPERPTCDHTLKQIISFLRSHSLNPDTIVPWLRELGGFCDCEVLANVEDRLESILK